MANAYSHGSANRHYTWVLFLFFIIAVIAIGWVFSQAMGEPLILYFAVAFSIISSFVSYFWSDKIVLMFSGAKQMTKDEIPEVYRLVENLCISSGLPMPKIYIIDDQAPNAFATGRNYEHACIALTIGILGLLEKDELEGVIAHELSHIKNKDILLATVVTVMVGVIVMLADFFRHWSFFGGRRRSDNSEGSGQVALIMTIVAIALSILAPIFATLMQLAISRKREFLADADGALMTRYPEGLAKALEKISQAPLGSMAPSKATAHLYFASPFKDDSPYRTRKLGWFGKMFLTHPPVEERIARLREMNL